jgi:hypothetical protein
MSAMVCACEIRRGEGRVLDLQGVQVAVRVLVVGRKCRQERRPRRSDLAAPEEVADRVLHDALEQQRQFFRRPVSIFFGEAEHRVLDDVQRGFVIVDGKDGLLESTAFNAFEEVREFLMGGQLVRSRFGFERDCVFAGRLAAGILELALPCFALTRLHDQFKVYGFRATVSPLQCG